MLKLLGHDASNSARSSTCYFSTTSYSSCALVRTGYEIDGTFYEQHRYYDCSTDYLWSLNCQPEDEAYVSPTAEDEETDPDSNSPSGGLSPFDSFIKKYPNKFTTKEKSFIQDNEWIIPYLEDFLVECDGMDSPGRPDLGVLGNLIRNYIPHSRGKDFFEHYWLGKGDWYLPSHIANEIINLIHTGKIETTPLGTVTKNGVTMNKYKGKSKGTDYEYALGAFTYYTTPAGTVLEIYDYYDFNWNASYSHTTNFYEAATHAGATTWGCFKDRDFAAEWQTRAVSVASLFSSAKNYHIYWP